MVEEGMRAEKKIKMRKKCEIGKKSKDDEFYGEGVLYRDDSG